MGKNMVDIKQYKTINSCLAAFFRCMVKDLDKQAGCWDYIDSVGVYHKTTNKKKIKELRKGDYWGWTEGKDRVHFWVNKKASMIDIVHLFAHEFGHCVRPFHRSLMEEHKAAKYADVAITAYEMARRIKGGETGDWIAEVICSNNEGE